MTSDMSAKVDVLGVEVLDPETGRSIARPVSFSISTGDLCVITGPNGVGKSTLLHGIASFLTSKNSNLSRLKGEIRADKRINVRLHPQLSAPMFALPLSLGDVLNWYRSSKEPASELAAGIDLLRPWDSASGGEKQRVLLAGLFAEGPSVTSPQEFEMLLLDEPGNHLDSKNRDELLRQIRRWLSSSPRRSVVVVTHDTKPWNPSVLVTLEAVEK